LCVLAAGKFFVFPFYTTYGAISTLKDFFLSWWNYSFYAFFPRIQKDKLPQGLAKGRFWHQGTQMA
jgi:hypothetical protein